MIPRSFRSRSRSILLGSLLLFALRAQLPAQELTGEEVYTAPAPVAEPRGLTQRSSVPTIEWLPPAAVVAASELESLERRNQSGAVPLQDGFTRPLAAAHRVTIAARDVARGSGARSFAGGLLALEPDHVVWSAGVEVEEAFAVRLHLGEVELPRGARLWVYSLAGEVFGPLGEEMLGPDRDLWLPPVHGELVYLEIEALRSAIEQGETLAFALADLIEVVGVAEPQSTCEVDGMCVSSSVLSIISSYREAVARLSFVVGGSSFLCSGALVNDWNTSNFLPYLLTANHCFSTQSSASSLIAYFDYRPSSCNGSTPPLSSVPSVAGSTLLATHSESDFTFVKLSNLPVGTSYLLGWSTIPLSHGQTLHRLSHPGGRRQAFSRSSFLASGGIVCSGFPRPDFMYSSTFHGSTEGGSSGAPTIVDQLGGTIVGQLFGACHFQNWDVCNYSTYNELDGAFPTTFKYVSPWLLGDVAITSAFASPDTVAAGDTFMITYNLSTENSGSYLLGASLGLAGSGSFPISDPANDLTVSLPAGASTRTRLFTVPGGTAAGTYDLAVAVWRDVNVNGQIDGDDSVLDFEVLPSEVTVGAKPVVTVVALDSTAGEPSNPGTFRVSRTGGTSSSLAVLFSLGGSAGNGSDYGTISSPVTIGSGAAFADVGVNPIDDAAVEGAETAVMTLSPHSAYTIGSPGSATVTIGDNDSAPTCFALTRSHTGNGGDPTAQPPSSPGCATGQYQAGEVLQLTASPAAGNVVASWSGTGNDSSTATTNSVVMPGASHAVAVHYAASSSFIAFSHAFESNLPGLATMGLWHRTSACQAASAGHSLPVALSYGIDATCNYENGATNSGTATLPLIGLDNLTPPILLAFKYFLATEDEPGFDLAFVEVSADGGPYQPVAMNQPPAGVVSLSDPSGGWQSATVDLSSFAGAIVRVRFRFDTMDSVLNAFPGFSVDDVQVTAANCQVQVDLTLQNLSIGSAVEYEACDSISAGPSFFVEAGGDVTFHAGKRVALASGFAVKAGGSFKAVVP